MDSVDRLEEELDRLLVQQHGGEEDDVEKLDAQKALSELFDSVFRDSEGCGEDLARCFAKFSILAGEEALHTLEKNRRWITELEHAFDLRDKPLQDIAIVEQDKLNDVVENTVLDLLDMRRPRINEEVVELLKIPKVFKFLMEQISPRMRNPIDSKHKSRTDSLLERIQLQDLEECAAQKRSHSAMELLTRPMTPEFFSNEQKSKVCERWTSEVLVGNLNCLCDHIFCAFLPESRANLYHISLLIERLLEKNWFVESLKYLLKTPQGIEKIMSICEHLDEPPISLMLTKILLSCPKEFGEISFIFRLLGIALKSENDKEYSFRSRVFGFVTCFWNTIEHKLLQIPSDEPNDENCTSSSPLSTQHQTFFRDIEFLLLHDVQSISVILIELVCDDQHSPNCSLYYNQALTALHAYYSAILMGKLSGQSNFYSSDHISLPLFQRLMELVEFGNHTSALTMSLYLNCMVKLIGIQESFISHSISWLEKSLLKISSRPEWEDSSMVLVPLFELLMRIGITTSIKFELAQAVKSSERYTEFLQSSRIDFSFPSSTLHAFAEQCLLLHGYQEDTTLYSYLKQISIERESSKIPLLQGTVSTTSEAKSPNPRKIQAEQKNVHASTSHTTN